MKEISLTQGEVAIVDDADYPLLNHWKWYVNNSGKNHYAMRREKETGKLVRMHREILGAKEGQEVDHINGNGLDNRRVNIRFCTRSQNLANSKLYHVQKTSQYKGVYWDKQKYKWRACIKVNSKTIHLGYFLNEVDAANAYDIATRRYFGEFARPNFQLEKETQAMNEFFRLCVCGHRESQHKLVVKSIFYERKNCHVCDCESFVPKKVEGEKQL